MIKNTFYIVWIIGGLLWIAVMSFALIIAYRAISILSYINAWLNSGAMEELLQNIMRGI